MTKSELKEKMQAAGILQTYGSRHELWVKAFEMYNQGNKLHLKMGCGSCFSKVRNWLNNG